tara:strand:+ start:270 stop:572 length:303 start_codon:yes stop_codon:yes gene_type:complete
MTINSEKLLRYLYVAIFCLSQLIINLRSMELPIVDRLLAIAVCAYGALLVYEFLFKKTMSATGMIIPYGEKPESRLLLLAVGCSALIYGYRAIYVGLSFM